MRREEKKETQIYILGTIFLWGLKVASLVIKIILLPRINEVNMVVDYTLEVIKTKEDRK